LGAEVLKAMNEDSQLKRIFKKFGSGLLALSVIVLIVHDVFGTHGYLAMRRTQAEINKVSGDLDHLNKENIELQKDVKDLQTDPRAIEKIARDEFDLVGPNDRVLKTADSHVLPAEVTQKR
jgi:cell division protein FtsB